MPRTLADRMSPSTGPRYFTEREVARHRTKDSCWVLLGNRVYDVTAFLRMHPGGEALILRRSGDDVSQAMEGPPHRHSENARRWMEQYYIGELRAEGGGVGNVDEAQVSPSAPVAPVASSVGHALMRTNTGDRVFRERLWSRTRLIFSHTPVKVWLLSFPSMTLSVFIRSNCGNSQNRLLLGFCLTPVITPEVSIILTPKTHTKHCPRR